MLERLADTLNSSTWRVPDGHLALARGETARASMRVERARTAVATLRGDARRPSGDAP